MSVSRHCGTILQRSVRTLQMVLQVESRIHDVEDRPYLHVLVLSIFPLLDATKSVISDEANLFSRQELSSSSADSSTTLSPCSASLGLLLKLLGESYLVLRS
jgi:hypothetical protein